MRLAVLMSHFFEGPRYHTQARKELQDRLLDLTYRVAREHVPYYERRLPSVDSASLTVCRLRDLPTISRAEAYKNNQQLISPVTTFAFVTFTSGTTRQPPLLIERSTEEQQYISSFFMHLQASLFLDSKRSAPLGLSEGFLDHGSILRAPAFGYSFVVELATDRGQNRALWLLQKEFQFPRIEHKISALYGSFYMLRYLCELLKAENAVPPPGQLRSVTCFGSAVSHAGRQRMAAILGVPIGDNYSLAEMFGGARYCHQCDAYHFDPFVIPEVVDLANGEPVEMGSGELVLTPLFPFTQRFVLIRYRTGDLVERIVTNCDQGEEGYRFRGRLKNSIEVGRLGGGLIIGEAEIADALDSLPEVNRSTGTLTLLSDRTTAGIPMFRISRLAENGGLHLELELNREIQFREPIIADIRKAILSIVPGNTKEWLSAKPERILIDFIECGILPERDYFDL